MSGYRLECAGSLSASDAMEVDIRRAFEDDAARGEYAILFAPDGSFMQIGEGEGPFVVEHRDGATEEHIQTTTALSKAEARKAFLQFLQGSDSWRKGRTWKPLEEAPRRGCLSVVLLALLLIACLGCQRVSALTGQELLTAAPWGLLVESAWLPGAAPLAVN